MSSNSSLRISSLTLYKHDLSVMKHHLMLICPVWHGMYSVLVGIPRLGKGEIPVVWVVTWCPVGDILKRNLSWILALSLVRCYFVVFPWDFVERQNLSHSNSRLCTCLSWNWTWEICEKNPTKDWWMKRKETSPYVVNSCVRSVRIFSPWISFRRHWRASMGWLSSINSKYFCSSIKYFIC